MPPEYCSYGPDYETHCLPWLKKNHPDMHREFASLSLEAAASKKKDEEGNDAPARPSAPWTTEQRLVAFYTKYVPDKLDSVPSLLEKYAGKEENLFKALEKKYGPEPPDPYYGDLSEDEEEDEDEDAASNEEEENDNEDEDQAGAATAKVDRKQRRGVAAKKDSASVPTHVVIKKVAQKKKRFMTVVSGMETVRVTDSFLKLKDVSKEFSKKFAGSSSVKDTANGKSQEIILQGDHLFPVAEFICDKYGLSESCVFLDMGDGSPIVPLR
jgi:density-regulated protein